MHYLECIALLEFLRKKLCAGQRQQVPVSVVSEAQTTLVSLRKRLQDSDNQKLRNALNDLMVSVYEIQQTPGLQYLSETMKVTIVDGIRSLYEMIALEAFDFFKVHEFDPTDNIVPIMRGIVRVALTKGVV